MVCVIGDGAITAGLALEALNQAGHLGSRLILILNDNGMSISPTVGALAKLLAKVRFDHHYHQAKKESRQLLTKLPLGNRLWQVSQLVKRGLKGLVMPTMIWEELGFTYIGPVDGHNIRELEGALTRLLAQVLLTHMEPTLELARIVVSEIGRPSQKQITIEQTIQMTAKSFGVPEERFMKKDRKKHVALARQAAMHLAVELTNYSTVNIGLHFGGRDHATVIYAHKVISARMTEDTIFNKKMAEMRKRLEYMV